MKVAIFHDVRLLKFILSEQLHYWFEYLGKSSVEPKQDKERNGNSFTARCQARPWKIKNLIYIIYLLLWTYVELLCLAIFPYSHSRPTVFIVSITKHKIFTELTLNYSRIIISRALASQNAECISSRRFLQWLHNYQPASSHLLPQSSPDFGLVALLSPLDFFGVSPQSSQPCSSSYFRLLQAKFSIYKKLLMHRDNFTFLHQWVKTFHF